MDTDLRFAVAPITEIDVRDPSGNGDNSWTMSGYAAVFNETTTLYDGKFVRVTESIDPKFFDGVLERQELSGPSGVVHFNFGHDMNRAVAATDVPAGQPGSLELRADEHGLRFLAKVPRDDPDGVALAAKMRSGVVKQASFAFTVADSRVESTDNADGGPDTEHRTLLECKRLYDVCAAPQGAYSSTVSGLRTIASALGQPDEGGHQRHPATGGDGTPNANEGVSSHERVFEDGAASQQELVEARARATAKYKPLGGGVVMNDNLSVNEPDLYEKGGRSFFTDLWNATVKGDYGAKERIDRHQAFEIEKRAVTSGTLGGVIPPAYLIDLYAKASRGGRVYADQCNNQQLPDVGMSVVLPRFTTGLTAGVQATENTVVATQDPVEADLSVPVRTLAGYSPVSRQSIERAAYSDQILFEDLTARYWSLLDTQCISGTGASGQILGVLNTAGISTSTAGTATVAAIWPKLADIIQQINTQVGGIGYRPDKIVMHPRRWGFFEAAVDTQNRPLFGINGQQNTNVVGQGDAAGYGPVGFMHGLPVFTDANIPTNLGAATNEDRVIVFASPIVHLFERANDPVTVSFEATNATALQVQLVVFGYVAYSAGRYPAASGVISGAGLVPPTF